MPTESITIQIQGDSSGLSAALDDALSRVQSLQSATDRAGSSVEGIGGRLAGISTALGPLNQVGQALTRISQQALAIGQQPITLNVQPALNSLQSLMSAIQSVAAQLQSLSLPSGGFPSPIPGGGTGVGGPSSGSPGGGSSGGSAMSLTRSAAANTALATAATTAVHPHGRPNLAESPLHASGTIRQRFPASPFPPPESRPLRIPSTPASEHSRPARLRDTMRTEHVDNHSHAFTDQHSSHLATSTMSSTSAVNNHFGGITISVRETADVNTLMRDLRLQGLSIRHRQG